jgi:hypothetical protein
MRLVASPGAEDSGVPYFVVVGHWKREKLVALAGGQESKVEGQEPEALESRPGRLPQEVLLLIGQDDLFPYRVEYRNQETRPSTPPAGRPASYQLSTRPTAVLEFFDVAFDTPIDTGQFDYAPRDVDWKDHTAALLERLRRERQPDIATRPDASQPFVPTR